jgi:hypothetical protein
MTTGEAAGEIPSRLRTSLCRSPISLSIKLIPSYMTTKSRWDQPERQPFCRFALKRGLKFGLARAGSLGWACRQGLNWSPLRPEIQVRININAWSCKTVALCRLSELLLHEHVNVNETSLWTYVSQRSFVIVL